MMPNPGLPEPWGWVLIVALSAFLIVGLALLRPPGVFGSKKGMSDGSEP